VSARSNQISLDTDQQVIYHDLLVRANRSIPPGLRVCEADGAGW